MESSISDLVWESLDRSSFGNSFAQKSFTGKKSTPKSLLRLTPTNKGSPSLSLKTSRHNNSQENISSDKEESKVEEVPPEIAGKPLTHSVVKRIQRDLRSLSASARLRALKALRSPAKSSYENFDVPHEEQQLITDEEKKLQTNAATSIQEVLKDVVIYVEVRTGVDNRSAGIKKVISSLGAKVNDRFLRDTTHVVFKDGLQSTYNKAKKWDIPIVSILWIEECKKNMKLMDPKQFPISNVNRYENPELYSKMKRPKSLQPNAEEQRRRRLKNRPEETKPNDANKISPAVHFPKKPKDKLREIFGEFQEKLKNTAEKDDSSENQIKILQRIRDSPYLSQKKNKTKKIPIDGVRRKINFSRSSSLSSDDYDFETSKNTSHYTTRKMDFVHEAAANLNSSQKENNTSENARPRFRRKAKDSSRNLANSTKIDEFFANEIEGSSHETSTIKSTKKCNVPDFNASENNTSKNERPRFPRMAKDSIRNLTNSSKIDEFFANDPEDSTNKTSKIKSTNKCNMTGFNAKIQINPTTRRKTSLTQYSIEVSAKATGRIRIGNHTLRQTVYSPQSMEETKLKATVATNDRLTRSKNKSINFTTGEEMYNLEHTDINCDKATISAEIHFNPDKPELTTKSNKTKRTLLDMPMDISEDHLENVQKPEKRNVCNTSDINVASSTSAKKINLDTVNKENGEKVDDAHQQETGKKYPNLRNNKKKRKLYTHTELNSTPPPEPPKQTETKNKIYKNDLKLSNEMRRSSTDFEKRKKIKNSCTQSQKQTTLLSFMVYTNMYSKNISFIKEAVSKLGGFKIEDNVSERTTHVLTLEPRRTINLLKGIIRGLWILNYKWIEDSYASGKWLYEEDYEVRDFSRAVQICRSERQAFGRNYRLELFEDIPAIFISPKCQVPKASLKELILLCGGKVTETKEDAKYIVGEYCDDFPNKIFVQPQWILDSITNIHIKKVHKYIISP